MTESFVDEEAAFKSKILELINTHSVLRFRRGNAELKMESDWDIDFDLIRLHIERLVACEKLTVDRQLEVVNYEYPASTWQMFKATHRASWWLKWLIKRRPIKMQSHDKFVEIEIQRYAGYPDAEIPSPKLGRIVPIDIVQRRYERARD